MTARPCMCRECRDVHSPCRRWTSAAHQRGPQQGALIENIRFLYFSTRADQASPSPLGTLEPGENRKTDSLACSELFLGLWSWFARCFLSTEEQLLRVPKSVRIQGRRFEISYLVLCSHQDVGACKTYDGKVLGQNFLHPVVE